MSDTENNFQEATGLIYNILSIDFDIIMYPCIRLYNSHIGGDDNPTNIWKFLEHEYEIDKYLSYDAKVLSLIAKVLKEAIERNSSEFIALEEHQMIVDDLKKDPNYETNLYNIDNIDYHHDVFYNRDDEIHSKYFGRYNCADWVGYLYKTGKLASYTWFKAPNSEGFDHHILKEEDLEKFSEYYVTLENDIKLLFQKKYAKVYFVKSPQWVPYKFHHLYDLLKDIFND